MRDVSVTSPLVSSDAELEELRRRYAPKATLAQLRARLGAPFEAARFGDLEDEVGPDAARQLVAATLALARRGVPADELTRYVAAEIEQAADAWAEGGMVPGAERRPVLPIAQARAGTAPVCGVTQRADSGDLRIEVRCVRVNLGVVVYGAIKVTHYKRDRNGRYEEARADRLEATGTIYLGDSFGVQAFHESKVAQNAKRVRAQLGLTGLVFIPFVEGCGGTQENSALWTCACSGNRSAIEQPGGEGGSDGGGGIIDRP